MVVILYSLLWHLLTSFYSLSFQNVDGEVVNMNNFQGKKVLIVNIATGSDKIDQLGGLQLLQQQFTDSLVVIVFPSNSFGHETRNNSEIKQFCQSNYNSTFIIASKSSVIGSGIHPVFEWLSKKSENGEMNAPAGADFQKFLIDKDGMLMGVFSSKISPTDSSIIQAVNISY